MDAMVLPVAHQLLTCFTQALVANPNPPAKVDFRPGDAIIPDFNTLQDECCEGLAYVRVARIYATAGTDTFPAGTEVYRPCSPLAWGVTFEIGVWRCEPQPTETTLVTTTQWGAVAEQIQHDWEAMTRALCCLKNEMDLVDPGAPVMAGDWTPLNAGGGCVGGAMNIHVQVMACAC